MTEFEQLKAFAVQLKNQRTTNLSEQQFHLAIDLSSTVLRDDAGDLTDILDTLDMLPVQVIAETVTRTWEDLPNERRRILLRWISRKEGDKSPKRILYCASRILAYDPVVAVELLSAVLNRDEGLSQESAADLRRAFGGKKGPDLALLASPQLNQEIVGRFCRSMFQVLEAKTPFSTKQSLARTAIEVAARRSPGDHLYISLASAIEAQLRTWPPDVRSEFAQYIRGTAPSLAQQLRLVDTTLAEPAAERIVASEQKTESVSPQLATSDSWLSRRINSSRQELQALMALERELQTLSSLEALQMRVESLERETQHKSELLEVQIARAGDLQNKLEKAEKDLSRAELEVQVKTTKIDAFSEENRLLGAQITGHAETSVEEFKRRLAATLAKLVVDLPDRTAEIDFDRLRFLLRQYHQFIDKLEECGVMVRSRRNGS